MMARILSEGVILQNRYQIIRRLDNADEKGKGKGGMGAVYLAKAIHLGCGVAVKQTYFANDAELAKAFEREAKLLANLRHDGLPRVLDYFAEGDDCFLVMEYVSGEDLDDMRKRYGGRIPVDKGLDMAEQLLTILEYLHGKGVIHRDIKPSNLKVREDGRLMLLDFGIAKGNLWTTVVGKVGSISAFTQAYASPEQIEGMGTDERSDIYSVGATFYELLTGQLPPNAIRRLLEVTASASDPLGLISEVNEEVGEEVSKVFRKAMALAPENRYSSAREMREELRKTLEKNRVIEDGEEETRKQSLSKGVILSKDVILQNRYQIIEKLSKGGMGAVYLAKAIHLGCSVAIKQTYFANDAELAKAFEREAKLLANLRHDGLPRVLDYFAEGGNCFLVMEYVSGETLEDMMRRHGGRIPVEMGLDMAEQLLTILEYLHGKGVIHRDIKPSNLKVRENGRLMLLDLGIAKGSAGAYTPSVYDPPEYRIGTRTDERSDIYSVGAMFYHLLTGQLPPDVVQRLFVVTNQGYDSLYLISSVNKEVSEGVSKVFRKAMALKAEDRYSSAREMREELRKARSNSYSVPHSALAPSFAPASPSFPSPIPAAPSPAPVTPSPPNNTLAFTSLLLGILSAVLICLGPCITIPIAIPAVVTGYIARSRADSQPEVYGGRGMANLGLKLGVISSIISTILWVIIILTNPPR